MDILANQQTIIKTIYLRPNWSKNGNEGFTQYLKDVYDANTSISELFEDKNIEVVSMEVTMNVTIRPVDQSTLEIKEAIFEDIPIALSTSDILSLETSQISALTTSEITSLS